MSSGELQGGFLCCDKRCGKLSNLGVWGCHRDYDLVCLDSLGTDILICLPPQTTIHTSSRERQQKAESRAAQATKAGEGDGMHYLSPKQSISERVPNTELILGLIVPTSHEWLA